MFELKIDSTLPLNQIPFICFCALQRSKEPRSDRMAFGTVHAWIQRMKRLGTER